MTVSAKSLTPPRYHNAHAYWEEHISKKRDNLEFYGKSPQQLTTRVVRIHYELDDERSSLLKAIASNKDLSAGWIDVTLFNIFAMLVYTYLMRISGARKLVIGTAFNNRQSIVDKETIGLFMQVLPLIVDIDPTDTFQILIKKVAASLVSAARHSGYHVRNTLKRKIYDVFLNYINVSINSFAEKPVNPIWLHPGAGNETFALQVHDLNQIGRFALDFDFDEEIFDSDQRDRAVKHFIQILDSFIKDYTTPLSDIDLLTFAERQQILINFNQTETNFPTDKTYPNLFNQQVKQTPDAIAAICGEHRLTYAQLNTQANRLARLLKANGVSDEHIVGLLDWRGLDLLIAIIAVMKAGGAYLPLDPKDPVNRHLQLLNQSQSRIVLASDEFRNILLNATSKLPLDIRPMVISIKAPRRGRFSDNNLPLHSKSKNLAYVIYTSGSTGLPKGVMIEHAGMINHICAKLQDTLFTSEDILAQIATQCFDSSVWQFLGPLLIGGCVHIYENDEASDPTILLNLLESSQVTILSTVPSLLRAMLETIKSSASGRWPLMKLKCLLEMGEALPVDLYSEWAKLYPFHRVINAYGLTECSDDVTHFVINCVPDGARVPIGGPIANTSFYLLDSYLQPVPVGVVGQLHVGGLAVGRGYINDSIRTAEKFLPDPFGDESGVYIYCSGDLACYLSDGSLDYLGRMDNQTKIRGFRIEFGEIESVLRQNKNVKESVVVAVDANSAQTQLIAYVVLCNQQDININDLRKFARDMLPDYMVPAHIVTLDTLPLNANGKIDRKALPRPEQLQLGTGNTYVSPRNTWELQLVQLWQDLLEVNQIGVTDNFFELGGHSLLAVRLLSQIRKRIGQEIPLSTLIESGTIERLAVVLQQQSAKNQSPLVPVKQQGSQSPLFCVHPGSGNVLCYLPLAQYIGDDYPLYGLQDINTLAVTENQSPGNYEVSIELLASRYVSEIRRIQPQGPYHLCGWSFGGFVVYEMAQQLNRMGEQVAFLAILDTGPAFENFGDADDAELLSILCEESGLDIDVDKLRILKHDEQLNYVTAQLKAEQRIPPDIPESWIRQSINIFKARITVTLAYKFEPYSGQITLFRAAEFDSNVTCPEDQTLGWQGLAIHPVEVHVIPGNHASMGREPHVAILATSIRECLTRIPCKNVKL